MLRICANLFTVRTWSARHAHRPAGDRDRRLEGEQQDRPRELPPDEGARRQVDRLHGLHRRRQDRPHHKAGREAQGEGRPRDRHRGGRGRGRRLHQVREVRAQVGQLQHRPRVPPGRQPRAVHAGADRPGRLRRRLRGERGQPRVPGGLPAGDRPQGGRGVGHRGGRHGEEAPRHLHPLGRGDPQQGRHRRRGGRGPGGHSQGLQQAHRGRQEHLHVQRKERAGAGRDTRGPEAPRCMA